MHQVPPLPATAQDISSATTTAHFENFASARDDRHDPALLTDCRKDLQHHTDGTAVVLSDHTTTSRSNGQGNEAIDARSLDAVRTDAERRKSPARTTPSALHSDAITPVGAVSPRRHTVRHSPGHSFSQDGGPRRERDRTVLHAIVDCKYLSASQVQKYVLQAKSITVARRVLQRLEAEGWLLGWEAWVASGGHTKYYLPRRSALAWALTRRQEAASATALARLTRTLIPTTKRKPVSFAPRTMPPFFEHQRLTNEVLLTLQNAGGTDILWATAWDRPLPKTIGRFAPPQPDAILVVQKEGVPSLLFIETDRASEHAPAFQRSKSSYAGLKLRSAILADLFGVTAFHVLVVVHCDSDALSAQRVSQLEGAARRGAFAELVTIRSSSEVLMEPHRVLADAFHRTYGREHFGSRSPER